MKIFEVTKQELVDYYARIPGKDGTDREMSKALYNALSTWGAQAEYITEIINCWLTAYHAAEKSKVRAEEIVYRNACENAARYIADLLRDCRVPIDGTRELALFRVLASTWERFARASKNA